MGSDQSNETGQRDDKPRKDTQTALSITSGSTHQARVETLPPSINIEAGLANIINIIGELEKDLPELSLHRLRDSGNLTAPGVRSAYDDAIARYQEARGNYDTGLIEAQKMAAYMMDIRRYDGAPGVNGATWEDEGYEHQIAQRPVISDSLGLGEQINLTLQAMQASAPKTVFIKMGWGDADADEIVASSETSRNQFMLGTQAPATAETMPPDDPEATPEDLFTARQNGAVNEGDMLEAERLLGA
jgi:hypothetical protein